MTLVELLEREEGFRESPYYCSEGYPTIGIGTRIGPKGADLSLYQFKVTHCVAHAMLIASVAGLKESLGKLTWFKKLNDDRKSVIISMGYQIGFKGLLRFKNMINALGKEDWRTAAIEALDSLWASDEQTPERADRHARVLAGETLNEVYVQ